MPPTVIPKYRTAAISTPLSSGDRQFVLHLDQGGDPRFAQLLAEAWVVHCSKAADYSDFAKTDSLANLREVTALGLSAIDGVLVRMSDKWSRIKSLWHRRRKSGDGPRVKDESLRDTFVDFANYALLAVVLLDEADSQ